MYQSTSPRSQGRTISRKRSKWSQGVSTVADLVVRDADLEDDVGVRVVEGVRHRALVERERPTVLARLEVVPRERQRHVADPDPRRSSSAVSTAVAIAKRSSRDCA